ncbi:prenyltransferase UbiA family protein [Babesia bovis T2Bo]|uniref:4-hydroxybenzoate polyprenyltransferase, mitochondrial n=1 Tax=Babesia bovis TaxID=5865 RepID=A7AM23_BABBO|nr:prenyltransferase UbiA family protein [Babesia bovis T2Bo]EDO07607.1 prenyltransferase UbiA family protein [Babesia bovis T2Bo]|eukprot:XP_001611175.1 prenyltransferase, UbiA family protein [Babesia bovis T2Bo]
MYNVKSPGLTRRLLPTLSSNFFEQHILHQRRFLYLYNPTRNHRHIWSLYMYGRSCPSTVSSSQPTKNVIPVVALRSMSVKSDCTPTNADRGRSINESITIYGNLMRLQNLAPVGIFAFPALWSSFMAISSTWGYEELKKMVLFCLGAFFGRNAGCCINDMADRNIDKYVERTKTRPMAAGLLSTREALCVLSANAALGLLVLLQFDIRTIRIGILTAIGSCVYPFMKRYTNFPPLFLGLATNLSVYIAWSAIAPTFTLAPSFLYIASNLWTLIYDTVYAHQDLKYDRKIGVKSLAIYWGDNTKKNCKLCSIGISTLLVAAGYASGLNNWYYGLIALSHFWMNRQINAVDLKDAKQCLSFFKRSVIYGALVLTAVVLGNDIPSKVKFTS